MAQYLIAYTCTSLNGTQITKSISFTKKQFLDVRNMIMLEHEIGKQTGDVDVNVISITKLAKIFDHEE